MKDEILEYHPNGMEKHVIGYYDNGSKHYEQFYDENGKDHRKNGLPHFLQWYENGMLLLKTYSVHGRWHNINGPSDIFFEENGKISWKLYYLKSMRKKKLNWMNVIKNI